MAPLNIRVKIVEPGPTNTEFTGRSMDLLQDTELTDYSELLGKIGSIYQNMFDPQKISPPNLVAGICPEEAIYSMIQEKQQTISAELIELEQLSPGMDCEELMRGFDEVIFNAELSRPYYERNKARFSFCNYVSSLQNYLRDIESLAGEIFQSQME